MATLAQATPARICSAASSAKAKAAVAQISGGRSESAESATSSANAPSVHPALKIWLSARGPTLQSSRNMKATSNMGDAIVSCSRQPPPCRQRKSRYPLSA